MELVSAKFTDSFIKISRNLSKTKLQNTFTAHKSIAHWLLNTNEHQSFRNFIENMKETTNAKILKS